MTSRFRASALALLLTLPLAVSAAAQDATPPGEAQPGPPRMEPLEPPANLPRINADRVRGLDFLFEALKLAPDAETAKHIENRIWAQWMASGSDTATLLMTRVKTATDARDFKLALQLLDAVVQIKPDYVEAWNRRATIHYMQKDFARSMADIEQVLRREPRHFGAISGLGMIMQEFGDEKRALDAFRRALTVHPHLQRVPDMVKSLTEKVEGRDI
jgi:tetratricopeptide (TPR) repeat protein